MKRFTPICVLVAICWIVFGVNNIILRGALNQYALEPRHLNALPGILWSPFLHENFGHIAANTLPLFLLGAMICFRSRAQFLGVTTTGIVIGGGLTWLLARDAHHLGASGLIFCYFGFLIARAFFDRSIVTFILAILCLVGFGGIIWGILPVSRAISWEGHAAGLAAGILAAWSLPKPRRAADPAKC